MPFVDLSVRIDPGNPHALREHLVCCLDLGYQAVALDTLVEATDRNARAELLPGLGPLRGDVPREVAAGEAHVAPLQRRARREVVPRLLPAAELAQRIVQRVVRLNGARRRVEQLSAQLAATEAALRSAQEQSSHWEHCVHDLFNGLLLNPRMNAKYESKIAKVLERALPKLAT